MGKEGRFGTGGKGLKLNRSRKILVTVVATIVVLSLVLVFAPSSRITLTIRGIGDYHIVIVLDGEQVGAYDYNISLKESIHSDGSFFQHTFYVSPGTHKIGVEQGGSINFLDTVFVWPLENKNVVRDCRIT